MTGLRRIALAPDALVVQCGSSGQVWLLEGAAAAAYGAADPAIVTEALAVLDGKAGPSGRPSRVGSACTVPDGPAPLELTVAFGGPMLRVRCWDARLVPSLAALLAPLAVGGASTRTFDLTVADSWTLLARDGRVVQETPEIGWWLLVRWLARELHGQRRWLGVLHAATIAMPFGTLALAGGSGAGKTTLAGAMVAAGGTLLADDATAIDAAGQAWPCPVAMSVKEGSWPLFTAMFEGFGAATAPLRLGAKTVRYFPLPAPTLPTEGRKLAAIVLPCWRAGAAAELTPARPGELLRALVQGGTWPPGTDLDVLPELLGWLRAVPAFRLTYGDTGDALRLINRMLQPGEADLDGDGVTARASVCAPAALAGAG